MLASVALQKTLCMVQLPVQLLAQLQPVEKSNVETWWLKLRAEKQQELAQLFAQEKKEHSIAGAAHSGSIFIEFTASAVGEPDPPTPDEVWLDELIDLYEYYEDRGILPIRTIHVRGTCTAHPVAREILRNGKIPASFSCPAGNAACPNKRMSKTCAGAEARLYLVFRRTTMPQLL